MASAVMNRPCQAAAISALLLQLLALPILLADASARMVVDEKFERMKQWIVDHGGDVSSDERAPSAPAEGG
jgi:hypothetical protein